MPNSSSGIEEYFKEVIPHLSTPISSLEEIETSYRPDGQFRAILSLNQMRETANFYQNKYDISIFLQADLNGKSFEDNIRHIKEQMAKSGNQKSAAYIWTGNTKDPNAKPEARMVIITQSGMLIEPLQFAKDNLLIQNANTSTASTEFPLPIPFFSSAAPAIDSSISAGLCLIYAKEYLKNNEQALKNSFLVPYDTQTSYKEKLEKKGFLFNKKPAMEFTKYFMIPPIQLLTLEASNLPRSVLAMFIGSDEPFVIGRKVGQEGDNLYMRSQNQYETNLVPGEQRYLVQPLVRLLDTEIKAAHDAGKSELAKKLSDKREQFLHFRGEWLRANQEYDQLLIQKESQQAVRRMIQNPELNRKTTRLLMNKVNPEQQKVIKNIKEKVNNTNWSIEKVLDYFSRAINNLKFSGPTQLGHFIKKIMDIFYPKIKINNESLNPQLIIPITEGSQQNQQIQQQNQQIQQIQQNQQNQHIQQNQQDQNAVNVDSEKMNIPSQEGKLTFIFRKTFNNKTNLKLINSPKKYRLLLFAIGEKNRTLQIALNNFFQQSNYFKALLESQNKQKEDIASNEALNILNWLDALEVEESAKVSLIQKTTTKEKFSKDLLDSLRIGKSGLHNPEKYFKYRSDSVHLLNAFISHDMVAENFFDILGNAVGLFHSEEEFFRFCEKKLSSEKLLSKIEAKKDISYFFSYLNCMPKNKRAEFLLNELNPSSKVFQWLKETINNWSYYVIGSLNQHCSPYEIQNYLNHTDNDFFVNVIEGSALLASYNSPKIKEAFIATGFFNYNPNGSAKLTAYKNLFKDLKSDEQSATKLNKLFCILRLLPANFRGDLLKNILNTKASEEVFLAGLKKVLADFTPEKHEGLLKEILGPQKDLFKLILANLRDGTPIENGLTNNLLSADSISKELGPTSAKKFNEIQETFISNLTNYITNMSDQSVGLESKSKKKIVFWSPDQVKANHIALATTLIRSVQKGDQSFSNLLDEALVHLNTNPKKFLYSSNIRKVQKPYQDLMTILEETRKDLKEFEKSNPHIDPPNAPKF